MDGQTLHPSTCLVLPSLCMVVWVRRIVILAMNMATSEVRTTGRPPEVLLENHLGLLLISMDEKMHRGGGTLSVTRCLPCQQYSLRMVPAMVKGQCLLCPLRSFKPAEAQMVHRDQEQEVSLQVQAESRSYAGLRLPQAGNQAVEAPSIGFFTVPLSVFHLVHSFYILLLYGVDLLFCVQFKQISLGFAKPLAIYPFLLLISIWTYSFSTSLIHHHSLIIQGLIPVLHV